MRENRRSYFAGIPLKIAVAPPGIKSVCEVMTPFEFNTLHEDSLRVGIISSKTKTIELLHAKYMASHYFDCDRFLSTESRGYKIAGKYPISTNIQFLSVIESNPIHRASEFLKIILFGFLCLRVP